jgi:hypothetical protein
MKGPNEGSCPLLTFNSEFKNAYVGVLEELA